MSFQLRSLLVLLVALGGEQALAQAASGAQLEWACWHGQRAYLTCTLRSASAQLAPVALPRNIPAVVQALRNSPEGFRNRFVHVPLLSETAEPEAAAMLARATMCGSRQDCSVHFVPAHTASAEAMAWQARLLEAEMDAALFGAANGEAAHAAN